MSLRTVSIRAAVSGKNASSFLLLYGDEYQVRAATNEMLDELVPRENRAFNLERFDGRAASWEQVEAALMTPPFFPGKKAVVVENAPYFLAQERKGEVAARILDFWAEGKQEQAARLLLDLIALQGWTQEEWNRAQGKLSRSQIANLCAADEEQDWAQIEDILAFCQSRGMGLSQHKSTGGQRLAEMVEEGLPSWATLVLTALHVDRRTRLYRRFEEKGKVFDFTLERDRSGRVSREALAEFLEQRLKEVDKKIDVRGKETILQRAGEHLWALHHELEKLFLYVGDLALISAQDVENVFLDQGDSWIFELTGALAQKDALGALQHLTRLVAQGEPPLKILALLASEVRRLLASRALIEGEMRDRWNRSMTFAQFQASVIGKSPPFLTRNPYGDFMAFQRAENFTTQQLLSYLRKIRDADIKLKSTSAPPARVLEHLVLEICLGSKFTKRGTRAPDRIG